MLGGLTSGFLQSLDELPWRHRVFELNRWSAFLAWDDQVIGNRNPIIGRDRFDDGPILTIRPISEDEFVSESLNLVLNLIR